MRHFLLIIVMMLFAAAPARGDDLQRIIEAGVVRAGVCLTAEPIGYRDSEGQPRGYDVDVATLMAEALGVRLELIEITVASRVADLIEGRIDVVVCNMTATPERARTMDFSFPYLRTGIKLMVRGGSGVDGFDDLATARIVVARGTTGEMLVRRLAPEAALVYAETPGDAVLLLRQGQADAFVEDSLVIDTVAAGFPDQLVALPRMYTMDAVAFGVRKGNPDFLRWLDLFASTYISSGTYEEVYARWFGGMPSPIAPVW